MLDTAIAERLERDGFALVPGALDAAWVRELTRAFDAAPRPPSGTQHVIIEPGVPGHEAWTALRTHSIALAAAEHVLAGKYRVRDLHGRNPLPGFGLQGLHTDWPERPDHDVIVTALFLIDEITASNGATRVVPGTHRLRRAIPKELAQPHAQHPDERIVTGPAGAVLLLNGHTWHSGTRNESRGPRRVAQMVIERTVR